MRIAGIFWAAFFLLSRVAAGQSFNYRADLEQVPATGFYQILLSPAITGQLQPGLSDIRLYEGQNQEMTYLLMRHSWEAAGQAAFQPVSGLTWKQYNKQQQKKTILTFSATTPVLIDKLVFRVAAPTLYYRRAILYQKHEGRKERRRRQPGYQARHSFVLAAQTSNALDLADFRSRRFYVEIHNGDNPPLVLEKIEAYQRPVYLVAFLEKGQSYYLAFGSKHLLPPPAYDLAYFRNTIPRQLPTLRPLDIQLLAGKQEKPGNPLNALFTSRQLIWLVLLVVIALLGYITYKMVQEAGRTK